MYYILTNNFCYQSIGRIKSDQEYRIQLQKSLQLFINPLDPMSHKGGCLVNIVTGQVPPDSVNVDRAFEIGKDMLERFESNWPVGFYSPIKKEVFTFDEMKNGLKSMKPTSLIKMLSIIDV